MKHNHHYSGIIHIAEIKKMFNKTEGKERAPLTLIEKIILAYITFIAGFSFLINEKEHEKTKTDIQIIHEPCIHPGYGRQLADAVEEAGNA